MKTVTFFLCASIPRALCQNYGNPGKIHTVRSIKLIRGQGRYTNSSLFAMAQTTSAVPISTHSSAASSVGAAPVCGSSAPACQVFVPEVHYYSWSYYTGPISTVTAFVEHVIINNRTNTTKTVTEKQELPSNVLPVNSQGTVIQSFPIGYGDNTTRYSTL